MDNLPEIFMVITVFLGVPTIISGFFLARKFLGIVERREETRQQELMITEKRLVLEERERELEIYKLELEIRHLERGIGWIL
jgi:hypothetical protein